MMSHFEKQASGACLLDMSATVAYMFLLHAKHLLQSGAAP